MKNTFKYSLIAVCLLFSLVISPVHIKFSGIEQIRTYNDLPSHVGTKE